MFFIDCETCKTEFLGGSPKGALAQGWTKDSGYNWYCAKHGPVPGPLGRSFDSVAVDVKDFLPKPAAIHDVKWPAWATTLAAHDELAAKRILDGDRRAIKGRGGAPSPSTVTNVPTGALDPRQQEFGFTRSEDGSADRYKTRKIVVPWTTHTFWWWVHNVIAHPIIGLLPFRPAFQFHDWTSRKMHGENQFKK